ncbi:phosphatidylinositol 4-phosphate 5-kinase-like protein 1 [Stylonychia lemnae]|uniref:Phosphatidylinositol 4-phosphate 5-kinase-like protein 1 n=1 Tax=Stylonychia lemnae TaxID=5949 RepID=A0A078BDF2_STYLE|nr:phosphatidylinositol 4-phosphate 5-kinase-like protein 1 [Stylonychia lemnae]|eukprot:CDW91623.1 phosphatidylinositol 4-phosphate 5-kinase-like protein 1 [Stylonychia lemnae]
MQNSKIRKRIVVSDACINDIDGLILLGLITLDIIITLHFIFSIFLENGQINSFICQFNGYLTASTFVASISYNISLSHCILRTLPSDQCKSQKSGWIYHLFSLSAGFVYISLAALFDDIGEGVMITCAMGYGTSIERRQYDQLGKNTLLWPYLQHACLQHYLGSKVSIFFFMFISGYAHLLTFVMQMNKSTYLRIAMMSVGMMNSIIRITADPYLRSKLYIYFCVSDKQTTQQESREIMIRTGNRILMDTTFSGNIRETEDLTEDRNNLSVSQEYNHSSDDDRIKMMDLMARGGDSSILEQPSQVHLEHLPTFVLLQENNIVENLKNRYAAMVYHFDKTSEEEIARINRKSQTHKNNRKLSRQIKINDLKGGSAQFSQKQRDKNKISRSFHATSIKQFQQQQEVNIFKYKIEEYQSKIFSQIRRQFGVLNNQIIYSFNPEENMEIFRRVLNEEQAGRSGKKVFKTHDKAFILKDINSIEKYELLDLAKSYSDHIFKNEDTLLARILGMFSFKVQNQKKQYFILMQNLDYLPSNKVIFRYDLKFSEVNRQKIVSEQILNTVIDILINRHQNIKEIINLKSYSLPQLICTDGEEIEMKTEISHVNIMENFNNKADQQSLDDYKPNQKKLNIFKHNTLHIKENSLRQVFFSQSPQIASVSKHKSPVSQLESLQLNSSAIVYSHRQKDSIYSSRQDANSSSHHQQTNNINNHNSSNTITLTLAQENQLLDALKLLKDIDFQNMHKQIILRNKSLLNLQLFLQQIQRDVLYLSDQNIMDYSLLLIIAKNDRKVKNLIRQNQLKNRFVFVTQNKNYVVLVGLIDYLQIFNFQRVIQGQAQKIWSYLKSKSLKQISCVEPIAYQERFLKGVTKIFRIDSNEENSQ